MPGRNPVNVAQIGSPCKVATIAGRCVDATGSGMVRAGESGTMATTKRRNAPAHAPAFITASAILSNPARYIAQHLSPYHVGARLSGRRYIPKYLHLAPNNWRHKQRDTVSVNNWAPPVRVNNCAERVSVNNWHGPVRVNNWHARLNVNNWRLAVSVTNPGARVRVGNPRQIANDKILLSRTVVYINWAYMISSAYRSAGNDKFCLYSTNVLLRMILIFRKYTCTTP